MRRVGWFLLFCLGINLVITLFLCPSCYSDWGRFVANFDDFSYSFLLTCFLSGGISVIVRQADRHFPWLDAPLSRLIFDLLVVTTYTFVVSFCLATIFSIYVWDYFTLENVGWGAIAGTTKTPIFIALAITVFFTSRSFLLEWRQAAIEAEQMRSERLAGQYQSLKEQLNPHFLFNSLNVLSNLVYEDADRANFFIEKLAKIYRYVLDVQHEELVDLEDELAFAKNYLELQELRFGAKFTYEMQVGTEGDYALPPLTLQMLLENVLKHNVATKASPLAITIRQEGHTLIVENNLQKRDAHEPGSGVGLKNIRERYRFLTEAEVVVTQTRSRFSVAVPLLPKPHSV
jgi:sensor histidine kinase YesM